MTDLTPARAEIEKFIAETEWPKIDARYKSFAIGLVRHSFEHLEQKGFVSRPPEKEGGPTLGRGKLYLNGVYDRSTPQITIFHEDGEMKIRVTADCINPAILQRVVTGSYRVDRVEYVSLNPIGVDTSFLAEDALLTMEPFDLKTEEWMTVTYTLSDMKFRWGRDD